MYIEDENISSTANFPALRKECLQLCNYLSLPRDLYPNISVLADEERDILRKKTVVDVAKYFYKNNKKIDFIKYLREKWESMSLLDAKVMADGYWEHLKLLDKNPMLQRRY